MTECRTPTKLVLIVGPNGVGKSTVARTVLTRLEKSAWLESEWCRMTNPFTLNEEIISLTISNISHMLRSYLTCRWLDYVIFTYGFHGPRQRIWDTVLESLQDTPHTLSPVTLNCSLDANVQRMKVDGRDQKRIERAIKARSLYEDLDFPMIDTTAMSIDEAANSVIAHIENPETQAQETQIVED